MHGGTASLRFPGRLACQQVAGPWREGLNPHCTEEDAEGPGGLWLPLGPRTRKAWGPPTSGNPWEGPTGSSLGLQGFGKGLSSESKFQDGHGVQRPERCIQAGRDVGPRG